mgnify:CR=1 FL=1
MAKEHWGIKEYSDKTLIKAGLINIDKLRAIADSGEKGTIRVYDNLNRSAMKWSTRTHQFYVPSKKRTRTFYYTDARAFVLVYDALKDASQRSMAIMISQDRWLGWLDSFVWDHVKFGPVHELSDIFSES